MDRFAEGTRQFHEGLRQAHALLSQLRRLTLRMVAHADQLAAAREALLEGSLRLRAASDQLAAAAAALAQIQGLVPGEPEREARG